MSTHKGATPGPWKQFGQHVRGPRSVAVAFCGCNTTVDSGGSYAIRAEEAEANARLIAAAPLLLEALIVLHAVVVGECPSLLDEDSGGDLRLAIAVEDAIHLATTEGLA